MVACSDGHRVVETSPELFGQSVLSGIRGQHARLAAHQAPIAATVDAREEMVLVVDDEGLRVEARGEIAHD